MFGNPPFVTNPKGSRYRNLYADFIEKTLADDRVSLIHMILPFSIVASRHFAKLRIIMREDNCDVLTSHFAFIPDGLFKFGKPKSDNTNKAVSQQITILTAEKSQQFRVLSSKLQRWKTCDRSKILGGLPVFHDVTAIKFNEGFSRGQNHYTVEYLKHQHPHVLGEFIGSGPSELYVAKVSRYYIGLREYPDSGTTTFKFNSHDDSMRFFGLLISPEFYDYWQSVGDGFHVTNTDIKNFPISESMFHRSLDNLEVFKEIWQDRENYAKTKVNSGIPIKSYDFTNADHLVHS